MADEDRPPLTSTEAAHVEQQQAVERAEAQTGTEPVQRTMATEEPTTLDPRFDRVRVRRWAWAGEDWLGCLWVAQQGGERTKEVTVRM